MKFYHARESRRQGDLNVSGAKTIRYLRGARWAESTKPGLGGKRAALGLGRRWAKDSISQNQLPERVTNVTSIFAGLQTHEDPRGPSLACHLPCSQ